MSVLRNIPVDAIDDSGRLRPASDDEVRSLALDIEQRGLRTPIEVAKKTKGNGYKLVSGMHRLQAAQLLGWTTIPAFIATGNQLELRRDEILENIQRVELSKLDRALFLAEYKRVHFELYPEAAPGGDRRSEDFQAANFAVWSDTLVDTAGLGARSIRYAAAIGERLAPETVAHIRATPLAQNQKELDALSKAGPDLQLQIVAQLTSEKDPTTTVAAALKRIQGSPAKATDPDDEAFRKLVDLWSRATPAAKRRFKNHIGGGNAA